MARLYYVYYRLDILRSNPTRYWKYYEQKYDQKEIKPQNDTQFLTGVRCALWLISNVIKKNDREISRV